MDYAYCAYSDLNNENITFSSSAIKFFNQIRTIFQSNNGDWRIIFSLLHLKAANRIWNVLFGETLKFSSFQISTGLTLFEYHWCWSRILLHILRWFSILRVFSIQTYILTTNTHDIYWYYVRPCTFCHFLLSFNIIRLRNFAHTFSHFRLPAITYPSNMNNCIFNSIRTICGAQLIPVQNVERMKLRYEWIWRLLRAT